MDIRAGRKYPAGELSNFAYHPFVLDGVNIASMEGFLQSLKFQNTETEKNICGMVGLNAKRAGTWAWQRTQTLFWRGTAYWRSSEEYQELLDRAYVAMFTQNEKARKALLASGDEPLTHTVGWHKMNETLLTKREFCDRLMHIRDEIRLAELVEF